MSVIPTEQLRRLMAYEASRTAPPEGFPDLPPISSERYTSELFSELERESVFGKSWLLAGHFDEIPEPGCFQRWDHAGVPVVLVHDAEGDIHALVNRCSHRGAPVVLAERGRRMALTCGYHGWTYSHTGDLIAVASESDFRHLDKRCLGLRKLRCERLGKLIFVNFDDNAGSLIESLGAIVDEWREFDLAHCRLSRRDRFVVQCNWKIAMEANMEVYHVPTVHSKTVASVLDSSQNVNTFYPGGHGRMVAPIPSGNKSPEWHSSWPEITTAGEIARTCTLSYNVFPNLVVPLNQFVVPPILFWPNGPDQCIVETWTMAPDWGDGDGPNMWVEQGDGENLDRPNRILREDIEMSEAIQAVMTGSGPRTIPLSYQEARLYYWHQTADTVIGEDRIPEALRVKSVIGDAWWHPNEPRDS